MLIGEENVSRHADPGAPSVDAGTQAAGLVAIGAVVVAAAAWVAWEFLAALVWAAIIAIATWPLYNRLAATAGRRSQVLAPLCFTLVLACFVIVPTMLLARQIAEGSGVLLASFNSLAINGIGVPPWLSRLPRAGQYLDQWWRENLSDPDALVIWLRRVNLESLATWAGSLGGAMLRRALELLTMLLALFIALRDGAWLALRFRVIVRNLLGTRRDSVDHLRGCHPRNCERYCGGLARQRRRVLAGVRHNSRAASIAVWRDHGSVFDNTIRSLDYPDCFRRFLACRERCPIGERWTRSFRQHCIVDHGSSHPAQY